MLGIGITTRNRQQLHFHQRGWLEAHTPRPYRLVVIDDHSDEPTPCAIWSPKRLGVAAAKTACLWRLQDCDPIILLDDDVWPTDDRWTALLMGAQQAAGIAHLIYVPVDGRCGRAWDTTFSQSGTYLCEEYTLVTYGQCSGVLMYLTRQALERVGAFGRYPGFYGYEHAGYSQRIAAAGLQGAFGPYVTVQGLNDLMWSVDFNGRPADYYGPAASSLQSDEALEAVQTNGHYLPVDITQIHQPLYDPLGVP